MIGLDYLMIVHLYECTDICFKEWFKDTILYYEDKNDYYTYNELRQILLN